MDKHRIKQIILFSYGDSNQISTWSNVPYLMAKTLENKGIRVVRVNLLPNRYVMITYNILFTPILQWIYKRKIELIRTKLYRWYANSLIKRAVLKNEESDFCIFTCYDFLNSYNSIPTILFCDWDYETSLERMGISPEFYNDYDRRIIKNQSVAMRSSKCVVSLFPSCAISIKKHFNISNVFYLGGNVINCVDDERLSREKLVAMKKDAKMVLFIGSRKYLDSAKMLIKSVQLLHEIMPNLSLHIIGISANDIAEIPSYIHLYGYLDKNIESQCSVYYELIKKSAVIVNPTPQWGGFSSVVEAMYFYTPVIVSPYKDFVETFGEQIDFGFYNMNYNEESISSNIKALLEDYNYEKLCMNAHTHVKDFTWSAYMDKFMKLLAV